MAFRKHVMISIVLLAISGLLFGCSDNSTTAPQIQTEAPILAPANVTATILTDGNVSISWDASTQTHLKGYNVYRLDIEAGQIGKLNPSILSANSYVDNGAQWRHEYQYRVTAVSVKNVESAYATVTIELTETSGKGDGSFENGK